MRAFFFKKKKIGGGRISWSRLGWLGRTGLGRLCWGRPRMLRYGKGRQGDKGLSTVFCKSCNTKEFLMGTTLLTVNTLARAPVFIVSFGMRTGMDISSDW